MKDGQIILTADDGSEEIFFVRADAEIAGGKYLLVVNSDDEEEEEVDALILKECQDGDIVVFDVLDDEDELRIISKYFEELLEDIDFEME